MKWPATPRPLFTTQNFARSCAPGHETARKQYRREDLRYASDMTDAEWALIQPHMPAQKALGRP